MEIVDFKWEKTSNTIRWTYKKEKHEREIHHLLFAFHDIKNGFIRLETGEDFNTNEITLLRADSTLLFRYNLNEQQVSWLTSDSVTVECEGLTNAMIYLEHELVLMIYQNTENIMLLKGYNLNGNELFNINPPENFDFQYLEIRKNAPFVVCEGNEQEQDQFGRGTYRFSVDPTSGTLKKHNLSY